MNHEKTLNHAEHNFTVCQYLKKETNFDDWVITTAFYSAIHYVQYQLFPNQYDNPSTGKPKQFNRFDDYYSCAKGSFKHSKHKVLQDLVEEYMPEIANEFQVLKDNCWTARYIDYKFNPKIAQLCIDSLKEIKALCE